MNQNEGDFDSVDRDARIPDHLGVDADLSYDIISRKDWYRGPADRQQVSGAYR
jgi:hypothetical protein